MTKQRDIIITVYSSLKRIIPVHISPRQFLVYFQQLDLLFSTIDLLTQTLSSRLSKESLYTEHINNELDKLKGRFVPYVDACIIGQAIGVPLAAAPIQRPILITRYFPQICMDKQCGK